MERLKPQKNDARNATEKLKSVEENMVVFSIEGRRKINKDQNMHHNHPQQAEYNLSFWVVPSQCCDMDGKQTGKGTAGHRNSSRRLWPGMNSLRLDGSS